MDHRLWTIVYGIRASKLDQYKTSGGGEIFFADESGKYAMVGAEPKCGRLVGFCAGTECLHGVKKLKKGERCALPVWFTTRKERLDFTLKEAQRIIDEIDKNKTL